MFAALIAGFFLSMLAIPLLMRLALPLRLTDLPGGRKIHAEPIPRVGGIAIAIGTFLPVLLWLPMTATVAPFLAGCAILVTVGVLDDRFDLDYRAKFAAQIAAASLAAWGGVLIQHLPFIPGPIPWYLGYPLTVIFLVGVTNAINFLDGLDGLAAGHSVMTLSAIGILGYLAGDAVVSFIAIALIGSLFGFLRYNTYPARVFMGDAGSQLLGFGGAALALLLSNDHPGQFNAAFPFALIGLPLLDVMFVVATRLRQGKSPFAPDRNHIHHRLLALGLSHRDAVSVIYVVQAAFVFGAVVLRKSSGELLATGFLLLGGSFVLLLSAAGARAWHFESPAMHGQGAHSRSALIHKVRPIVLRLIEIATAGFLLVGSVLATDVSHDVALMAAVLAASLALALMASRRSREGLFRLMAYLASLLVAYFLDAPMQQDPYLRTGVYVFLIVLGALVFAGIRFSDARGFRATPQDFLILCLIVFFMALPPDVSVPASGTEGLRLGSLFFRVAVLFYATEILLSQEKRTPRLLNAAAWASLVSLGIRGWPL